MEFNVYILKSPSGKVCYVGQSISLKNRLKYHMKTKIFEEVEVFKVGCKEDMDCLEGYLIYKHSPPMNKDYPKFNSVRGEYLLLKTPSKTIIPDQSEFDGVVRKVLRSLSDKVDLLYYKDFTSKFTKSRDGVKTHEVSKINSHLKIVIKRDIEDNISVEVIS